MINLIYLALKKKLQDEVSPAYIDWYMGQYLETEEEGGGQLLWDTPAVFLEFQPITWKTLGGSVQSAEITFAAHLIMDNYHDSDLRITDTNVSPFNKEVMLYSGLMNWRCNLSYVPGFEALAGTSSDRVLLESIVRINSETDHSLRRQMLSLQVFSAKTYDYSAQKEWVKVIAALDLSIQKVNSL